jgi:hypothetical protein
MVATASLAAILVTVLLDPLIVGFTLTPLRRMLLMSSALPLIGGSACVILWWARYTVDRLGRDDF